MANSDAGANGVFDVAVVGGGVVGCGVLRALTLGGHSAVLLEKGPSLAGSLASGGNTGIACTAADTAPGSLERECLLKGLRMNTDVYRRLNVPHDPRGTLYVAWTDGEMARLASLAEKYARQGDHGAVLLGRDELRAWEPALSWLARGAMHVPGEAVVDPWLVPIAWAHHALENGASIELGRGVTGAALAPADAGALWRLATPRGGVAARVVVNCGGLWADDVERLQRRPPFGVRPKRGDYVVFARPAEGARLLSRPVGQVPSLEHRGVYVWQTLHGNVACGPTAVFQEDRGMAAAPSDVVERLRRIAVDALPALAGAEVLATYSGLRPATEFDDYQIEPCWGRAWITVGGVRSTGLTASLGIGEHVRGLAGSMLAGLRPGPAAASPPRARAAPKWTPLPPLGEIYRSFRERGDGTVSLHGRVHAVTHPLCRLGYAGGRSAGAGSSRCAG